MAVLKKIPPRVGLQVFFMGVNELLRCPSLVENKNPSVAKAQLGPPAVAKPGHSGNKICEEYLRPFPGFPPGFGSGQLV